MASLKEEMRIGDGEEWDPFAGLDAAPEDLQAFLDAVPFNQRPAKGNVHRVPVIPVPADFERSRAKKTSTQEAFGRILGGLARRHPEFTDRIVTTSPDVTVSTNLGSWVNRRGIFGSRRQGDVFEDQRIVSALKWEISPAGQHVELGIAENNLFVLLAALGLSGPLFGERLLPVGTVYDPFISRGLDALNYACYQNSRFMLVGTPSGISLAAEGGAHQSIYEPLIGLGQPGLTSFEPVYADELSEIMRWSFEHMQAPDGGAVYLRLSTRVLDQASRQLTSGLAHDVIDGGYWLHLPSTNAELALVACGPVLPEVVEAHRQITEDLPGTGLLVVTSVDRLYRGWLAAQRADWSPAGSHVDRLLGALPESAGLVTVLDGHPATLSWLGSVCRHRIVSLGVDRFGQSGDIPDLYRVYGLDAAARLAVGASARVIQKNLAHRS